ncbi:cell wall hydrolase [Parafrankia sp. BMG5.11]|uniref:cell wall hydrolase n=1 Tax=Parafrankia sp. BMG5.11 TaxID=222540 RepID=UPI0035A08656
MTALVAGGWAERRSETSARQDNSSGTALGSLPATGAPRPLPNIAVALEPAKARDANASLPFASDKLEAAYPVNVTGLGWEAASRVEALRCLAAAVYYEAASETIQGQRAVAQVVLNRVRHPSFPNSVCGVVYQGSTRRTGCQFTFTCDGSLRRTPSPRIWQRAEQIAAQSLAGWVEPSVGMATHYHTDWVFPYWAPSLKKITKIGTHIFYTWPGRWGRRLAFNQQPVFGGGTLLADLPLGPESPSPLPPLAEPTNPSLPPLAADNERGTLVSPPALEGSRPSRLKADEQSGTLIRDHGPILGQAGKD